MTREEIIAMAREAQTYYATDTWAYSLAPNQLERFATLVAAHEREECAKLCDGIRANRPMTGAGGLIAEECAVAIRARSET